MRLRIELGVRRATPSKFLHNGICCPFNVPSGIVFPCRHGKTNALQSRKKSEGGRSARHVMNGAKPAGSLSGAACGPCTTCAWPALTNGNIPIQCLTPRCRSDVRLINPPQFCRGGFALICVKERRMNVEMNVERQAVLKRIRPFRINCAACLCRTSG